MEIGQNGEAVVGVFDGISVWSDNGTNRTSDLIGGYVAER